MAHNSDKEMGYTKIVIYGNMVEHYQYEKNLTNIKRIAPSKHTLKRAKQARDYAKARGTYTRTKRSIKRSREAFFRLCHHNNCLAQSIHFVTLTFSYELTHKTATGHVREFMDRIKENQPETSISYISVPEFTKKDRIHFHLLIYNLSTRLAGDPISVRKYNKRREEWEVVATTTERFTRNLQRMFQRGFVDISPATFNSTGIAGYMAKYMAKALGDKKNESIRGFTTSRNIAKIYSAGGDTLSQLDDLLIPDDVDIQKYEYEVPFAGKCVRTVITKKI